jgi:rubredoxin
MKKYVCKVCGYVYDEAVGVLDEEIQPGTKWEDVPDDFVCPVCAASKTEFELLGETEPPVEALPKAATLNIKGLSAGEISAICSSLAKACEKQRLMAEMEAFNELADYFKSKINVEQDKTLEDAAKMLADDLLNGFSTANSAAKQEADRGAQRSLVWSEKVSVIMKTLLDRFVKGGETLGDSRIYVCDICGFIYVGNARPEICPVCKVPGFKMYQVEKR